MLRQQATALRQHSQNAFDQLPDNLKRLAGQAQATNEGIAGARRSHWYLSWELLQGVKKVGKTKLLGDVANAVNSVVKSKITAAAVFATAMVYQDMSDFASWLASLDNPIYRTCAR